MTDEPPQRALAPHADLDNPVYVGWKRFLDASAGWSAQEVEAYQLSELRRVVADAFAHAPAWRTLYESHGVTPSTLQTLDDVRRLPTVDKRLVREQLEAFSIAMDGRSRTATSGGTGVPFELYLDPQAFAKELASKAHQYERVGWREGDPQLVLRGLPIDSPTHMTFVEPFNELRCSSYHLSPEVMEQYRQAAFEYGPLWLRCYPTVGDLFARFLEDTGRPFPPLKGILCASENLYDAQRARLGRVFGARVFSHYGHYELSALAGFCEYRDTYHVLPQYGYAELLTADGRLVTEPGGFGEIVATSFINRGTPLIRYRTGDFAVLEGWGCRACGRPYQVWSRLQGRAHEFLVTSQGTLVPLTAMNEHDDTFDEVREFQIEQHEPGIVTFRYVPRRGATAGDVERHILAGLASKLGETLAVRFERVSSIARGGRGKHPFMIQHLRISAHRHLTT